MRKGPFVNSRPSWCDLKSNMCCCVNQLEAVESDHFLVCSNTLQEHDTKLAERYEGELQQVKFKLETFSAQIDAGSRCQLALMQENEDLALEIAELRERNKHLVDSAVSRSSKFLGRETATKQATIEKLVYFCKSCFGSSKALPPAHFCCYFRLRSRQTLRARFPSSPPRVGTSLKCTLKW